MTHTNKCDQVHGVAFKVLHVSCGEPYVTWSRCLVDGRNHAVTDEEFASGVRHQTGCFQALCGHQLMIDSSLMPPGPPCVRCRAYLAAVAAVRETIERANAPKRRRKALWSRFIRHAQSSVITPSNVMADPKVRRGRVASTAPALAGRQAHRDVS